MEQKRRTTGFRFSFIDGIVLVTTIVVTPWLVSAIGVLGWIPAFVVGHFFLFCNVFRIRRKPELIWAAAFVTIATAVSATSSNTAWMLILPLPLTIVLISLEVRHPTYHGIMAHRINSDASDAERQT